MTDDAAALRQLADDLESDAQEFDPDTPAEAGVQTGLGRAAGKARARAEQLEDD
jgi:hypothetical protein